MNQFIQNTRFAKYISSYIKIKTLQRTIVPIDTIKKGCYAYLVTRCMCHYKLVVEGAFFYV